MPRGFKTGLALAAVVALAIVAAWWIIPPKGGLTGSSGTAAIGGPFTLTDQHGHTFSSSALHGKLALIYFGYTYCPDVCPTELQAMSQAVDQLGEAGEKVTPVFITVDPERDTVDQLAGYAQHFHPRLVALTGSEEQVREAARAYRVYYHVPEEEGDAYLVDHSTFVYLMGPDGSYRTHFGIDASPEAVAAAIGKEIAASG